MKIPSFLKFYFAGLITLFIIINACSMKKRVYRHGYNIEWSDRLKNPDKRELSAHLHSSKPSAEVNNPLKGNVTTSISDPFQNKIHTYSIPSHANRQPMLLSPEGGCDTIIFKNGLKIKAKISELGANEIRYKMCDNQDGPTFIKNISDVLSIHHSNGSITELSPVTSPTSPNNNTAIGGSSPPRQDRTITTASDTNSDKSQITALLICIFLGLLGIHRFYLGYIGIGLLMLLTGGCCGILWIVDAVRIIIGDLTPKNGSYSEKL